MADETPSTAGLTMDRGLALGNSAGTSGRRRLHVFMDQLDPATEALPVLVAIPAGAFHARNQVVSTPGTPQDVLTLSAVPAGKVRRILSLRANCRFEASWIAKVGATVVADGRTGPGMPVDDYSPKPCITLAAGEVLTIEMTQANGPTSTIKAAAGGYDEDA